MHFEHEHAGTSVLTVQETQCVLIMNMLVHQSQLHNRQRRLKRYEHAGTSVSTVQETQCVLSMNMLVHQSQPPNRQRRLKRHERAGTDISLKAQQTTQVEAA